MLEQQLLSLTSPNSAISLIYIYYTVYYILEKYLYIYVIFPYYEIENTETSGFLCGDIIVSLYVIYV